MIEVITKSLIKENNIRFIKSKLRESKQVYVGDLHKRIQDIYLYKTKGKIVAFSCNKKSQLKNFDIELGYTWVDPNFRGNIYCVRLLDFQIKDIKNKNLKTYSINSKLNKVMVKYCRKNKFKIFATGVNNKDLQWRIIN